MLEAYMHLLDAYQSIQEEKEKNKKKVDHLYTAIYLPQAFKGGLH